MSMYFAKTPSIFQNYFPNFIWRIPTSKKVVYLTFDDGPTPDVTPWVLEQLATYNAKATFFAIGEQIVKSPSLYQQVVAAGHSVGNHSYSHPNGWATDSISYFHNIRHCARLVNTSLFRPPYGRLMPKQAQFLQRHYQIIMWDVLSGDFDPNISKEKCLANVTRNVKPGSIVVFHDNIKAKEKLEYTLPKILNHFSEKGYQFEALNDQMLNKNIKTRKIA